MPDKLLGMGGYGCILSPAVVFSDSKIVTEANKTQFVTKISSAAEDEYNFCEIAIQILGPEKADYYGIFPVDNLVCGVTKRDLGAIADEVLQKCTPIKKRTLVGSQSYYNFKMGGGTVQKNSYLCAIQYPIYDYDLDNYRKMRLREGGTEYDIVNIEDTLIEALDVLHSKGIYHLDIKGGNIGITGSTGRFADWDFACFERYEETINDCFYRTLQDNFSKYYGRLTLPEFGIPNVLYEFYQMTLIEPLSLTEKTILLRYIDKACLYSTILNNLWSLYGQEVYDEKKSMYVDKLYASHYKY